MNKKFLRRILAASVALGSFTFTPNFYNFNFMPIAFAQVETFEDVGEYIQSELITDEQAKNYARLRAELNIKEQVYIYLCSYLQVKNLNLTKDEIELIVNSIIKITNVNY